MSLGYTLKSIAEQVVGRPFLARDRILQATSDDGLTWRKEASLRFTYPSHRLKHMTYFAGRDSRGALWLRASVYDEATGTWHTRIGEPTADARCWWDARSTGLLHVYAPSWCRERVYGIGVDAAGFRSPVCFDIDAAGRPGKRRDARLPGVNALLPVLEDIFVLRDDGGVFHAWTSGGERPHTIAIHHWTSNDGLDWRYDAVAVEAPARGTRFDLANNPAVVSADGYWRMFFRTGDRPALGNVIRSATSHDLITWQHEEGVRVEPGGLWDSHGVGFPAVWRDASGQWTMLYAGYWGRGPGEHVARHWQREWEGSAG